MIMMVTPKELCQRVLDIHNDIRWVKIIDQQSKITFEAKKAHVEPYLSEDAMENLRMLWVEVIRGILGRIAEYWGPPHYIQVQFTRVTLFGFPYVGGTLIVVAEPTVPLTMITKIQDVLKQSLE